MENKRQLRQQLRTRRAALSPAVVREVSSRIAMNVLGLVVWEYNPRKLHIYDDNASWGEVATRPLVAELRRTLPNLEITVGSATEHAQIPNEQYDVIIAPVLGFDDTRYRLGLGLGWYDRFLAAQPQAYKLGIAYSWGKVTGLPHEQHDVRLDCICTEDLVLQ